MLRKIAILLLLLNLAWWAWAHNWLAPLGLPAVLAGDSDRLARQIRPEALRVQPLPPNATRVEAPAPADEAPAVLQEAAPEIAPPTLEQASAPASRAPRASNASAAKHPGKKS